MYKFFQTSVLKLILNQTGCFKYVCMYPSVTDCDWRTTEENQKYAIISCHASQVGHGSCGKNLPPQSVMTGI